MSATTPEGAPPTATAPWWRRLLVDDDPPGPAVARLYHRSLGAVSLVAWLSLLVQIKLLIGWRGLSPVQTLLINLRAQDLYLRWRDLPSHFFFDTSDTSAVVGCLVGVGLSIVALLGVLPRLALPLSGLLYLGYIHGGRVFLQFQWDNLLVEASVLAALLHSRRPDPLGWWAQRLLLVKLVVLSGVAKMLSSKGDWLDGTAMAHYYETAPLPTPLAWHAHHLPSWWHTAESWGTLVFELVLIWGAVLGRGPRRIALAAVLGFVVLDGLTANYGFFLVLTSALTLSLVRESTTSSIESTVRQRTGRPQQPTGLPIEWRSPAGLARAGVLGLWVLLSVQAALPRLTPLEDPAPKLAATVRHFRLVNTYHLFGSVTETRTEPEFQVSTDGTSWTALPLHHKPGPPDRAPSFLPLHMPRVDFRLWFHALSWQQVTRPYVANILRRLCHDPAAVAPLFAVPVPDTTTHVRIAYWDTRFAPPGSEDWWTRRLLDTTRTIPCDRLGR